MHRDVGGLVALDFILGIIRARVMSVSLVIDVFAADMVGLGFAARRAAAPVPSVAFHELSGRALLPLL
jgi:hypothetical protein